MTEVKMRRLLCLAVVGLALAACSDQRDPAPTSPDLQVGTGSACNYTNVKKFARNLFGSNSAGYGLAQQMSGFPANSAQATATAFDIFAAIAAKRDAGSFTTQNVSDAATLTVQTIACADVVGSGDLTVTAFSDALGSDGGYQVRGGGSDATGFVTTANGVSGIKPPAAGFASWLGGRGLFYGRPIETFTTELSGGVAYDWSTVRPNPAGALNGRGLVQICVDLPDDGSQDVADLRVQEHGTILPVNTAFLGCPASSVARANAAPPTLAGRVLGFFAPQPLYAAALARTGTPTGNAGSFSPFEAVNPIAAVPAFVSQPVDGRVNRPMVGADGEAISVKVTGSGGTPWEGVLVQITGTNNNGATVQFAGSTATTDAAGFATFPTLSTNKTGAYKLVATTVPSADQDVSTFDQASVTSRKFNIRP